MTENMLLTLWSGVLTFFGSAMAWLINRMFKMMDDQIKRHDQLRDHMNNSYVRRDDYIFNQNQILETLNRIETKLDGKADK
jgi:hypothetical protein